MDGSFLSDEAVIAASVDLVCARLMTYESAAEAPFLESLFRGRSGQLENTVYALLDPTGTKRLTRTGRSPAFAFGWDAEAPARMATEMTRAAKRYPAKTRTAGGVPYLKDVRLALNVAACDGLPLLITQPKSPADAKRLDALLTPFVWRSDLAGAFLFATTRDPADLTPIQGVKKGCEILIVAPGTFGEHGTVLGQLDSASPKTLDALLAKARRAFHAESKDQREHIRAGRRKGVQWETEIPVTDPGRPPPPRRR